MADNSNYGSLLYLNPELQTQCNITSAAQLRTYLQTNSVNLRSNAPPQLDNVDPNTFFAMNVRSHYIDTIHIDSTIRGSNPPATPLEGSYVPNIYFPSILADSNVIHMFTSNTDIETLHLAVGYFIRFVFPSGIVKSTAVTDLQDRKSVV
jgi:hypothetical protein